MKNFVAWTMFLVALTISGCSDPRSYEVSKLNEEQQKEIGKKLTAEEGAKLTGWQLRHALTGKALPAGVTVAQAMRDQDEWVAKQKEEEAKAAALKVRVEAERKAKQEEFRKLVSVAFVGKKNDIGEYDRRFVYLEMAYENKGSKDIRGIKGILRITDMFGDKIINVRWAFDDGVAAGKTFVEKGSGMKINQFMDEHSRLWNSDFAKLKANFEIKTIIFSDGTQADAPD